MFHSLFRNRQHRLRLVSDSRQRLLTGESDQGFWARLLSLIVSLIFEGLAFFMERHLLSCNIAMTNAGTLAAIWPPFAARRPNSHDVSDCELAQMSGDGDMQAFEKLYQRHSRRVYSVCLRMGANVAEAEDLTQDVFIQLFRKIGSFRGDSAFTTWLHRLAVNQVLMHFRKRAGAKGADYGR